MYFVGQPLTNVQTSFQTRSNGADNDNVNQTRPKRDRKNEQLKTGRIPRDNGVRFRETEKAVRISLT